MAIGFSEEEVHQFIYKQGLETLIVETPEPTEELAFQVTGPDESDFELWRVIKAKVEDKLRNIDRGVRYGELRICRHRTREPNPERAADQDVAE